MKSNQFIEEASDMRNAALMTELSNKGIKMISLLMKSKGYSTKTSRSGAHYEVTYTKPNDTKSYIIDGWHGAGAGNYTKTVFTLYADSKNPRKFETIIKSPFNIDPDPSKVMTPIEQKGIINQIYQYLEKNA